MDEIGSSEQFRHISHIPQLGATLLLDYVFSQQPRLAGELASRVTKSPGFRLLLATRYSRRADSGLTLPPGPAQSALVDACKQLLQSNQLQIDTMHVVCETLIANCTRKEIVDYWQTLRLTLNDNTSWIRLGDFLNLFARMSKEESSLLPDEQQMAVTAALLREDRFDVFEAQPERWKLVIDDILDNAVGLFYRFWPSRKQKVATKVAAFWGIFSG